MTIPSNIYVDDSKDQLYEQEEVNENIDHTNSGLHTFQLKPQGFKGEKFLLKEPFKRKDSLWVGSFQ